MADQNNPGDPRANDEEATFAEMADVSGANDGSAPAEAGAGTGEADAADVADAAADAVADEAETASEEAAAAAEAEPAGEFDPALEAEIDEALAGVDPDADGDGVISNAEQQLAERTEDLQRLSAEYTNYRRRVERDRVAVVENARAEAAQHLLPILDDLDMAAQHGDLTGPLKAVADKLQGALGALKVEAFGAEGDAFDPDLHEAVQDTSSGDEKVLGTVLRKGYRLNQRVLRNAMVVIADPA